MKRGPDSNMTAERSLIGISVETLKARNHKVLLGMQDPQSTVDDVNIHPLPANRRKKSNKYSWKMKTEMIHIYLQ
jgi:hypothetical protein